ncbi:M60 family metallopeptidase [uncultured Bacteroides sp.]|uniref:M60 family metallopeptidase n=1 Tax=uncultured Bacteroides sp. TaxID=162156 RepID=UPI00280B43AD|nr:M60 family metallopeptidase [uncultured Bacteroides sp.]
MVNSHIKKCLFVFFILIHWAVAFSCTSDDEALEVVELSVNKEVVDFKCEAGTQNITVSTNAPIWEATADKSWCTLSVAGKVLRIFVDESEERLVREAVITITAEGLKKTVKVRQLGYEPAILIDTNVFEVEVIGKEIAFNVTANVEVSAGVPDWIVEKVKSRAPEMVTSTHAYVVKSSTLDEKREGNIVFAEVLPEGASVETSPVSASVLIVQHGLNEYNGGTGEDIEGDIKVKVVSGTDTSHQGEDVIGKSFDGDYSTLYHSNWSNGGANYFPITLTYNFAEVSDVDYLIYSPRPSGYNGNFKEVEIQYSEDGNVFTKLLDKDFEGSATASRVTFDNTVRAKSFRFIVKSGAGDGQGFVSCAEMEFYSKNLNAFVYSTLFEDEACSNLKAGITETDIENCKYPFFKNLAYYMFKDKYDRNFRVADYKAFPHPDIQSESHKTNPYSLLDNPTGISVKEGETLVVMVADTYGQNIGMKVQNLDAPGGDGFGGVTYPLYRGINKLTMNGKGLVYVMYHTKTLEEAETARPVKIHFASGTVNGYFDSQSVEHRGRWSELLGKATDKYFDVVGQYAHLTFETNDFRKYAATNGNELIELYDKIAHSEMQLLGLEKYGKMFRNRIYLNVMYHSFMYATAYHTAYNQTTMGDVCDPDVLKTTGCWGPAHEIGHCNQTRPGIKWIGLTEVTNNIMSEYVQTTVFGQPSRIQTEDMGAVYRNRYSKAWNGIIVPKASHADFTNLDDSNDVFCKLVPFWQLELYFGKVLGLTPLQQSDCGGFYPEVFEYARTKDYSGMSEGEIQLDFVYNCCVAARLNLLDFFEKWGFLTPVDRLIEDYDTKTLKVTEGMVDALRKRVESLGYSKLQDTALEYISDNTWELYKTKPQVIPGASATRNGNTITIKNWQNVVVYEVRDEADNLVFVSSGETTPSATDVFTLSGNWSGDYRLYAVSAVGKRTEIPVVG